MFSFFIFFIISVISLGSVPIGPLSIRVYASAVMFFLLIFSTKRKEWRMPRKYIIVYCLYLLLYAIALLMNGDFYEHGFFKQFFAFHFICIIIFYSCNASINSYKKILTVTNIILGILTVNCIVTVLQYLGNPLGWKIAAFFNVSGLTQTMEENIQNAETFALGKSITSGIFPYVFTNAMFIASSGVIPFYWVFKSDCKFIWKVFYSSISILSVVACFMTQQRAAFIFMILAYVFVLLLSWKKRYVPLLILAIGALFFSTMNLDFLIQDERLGRIGEFESYDTDVRQDIWKAASEFLEDNLLWGGPESFIKKEGYASHNFVLNAFIYGGLFGGIFIITLFLMMVYKCFSLIRKGLRENNLSAYYAIGLLVFLICGFFHNASLVIGSSQIFVLFSLMLVAEHYEQQNTLMI